MDYNAIINKAAAYVTSYLSTNLSPNLLFHNKEHTFEVVAAAKEIGAHSGLNEEQLAIVIVAAWFHDCGYVVVYTGHEDESKKIAECFLREHCCPEMFIQEVLKCIEATQYPQRPQSLEGEVICDADLYHFTRPGYHRYEEALRKEFSTFLSRQYNAEEWRETNCEMLHKHSYHTKYGKEVLQKFKEVNMERMGCRKGLNLSFNSE